MERAKASMIVRVRRRWGCSTSTGRTPCGKCCVEDENDLRFSLRVAVLGSLRAVAWRALGANRGGLARLLRSHRAMTDLWEFRSPCERVRHGPQVQIFVFLDFGGSIPIDSRGTCG